MEKRDEKKSFIDIIVKIILIVIIILLLVHNCALINEKNKIRIPGGNIQIIEIKCDENNNCNVDPNNGKTDDDNKKSGNEEKPGNTAISVYDNEHSKVTWNGASDLKIFTNPVYEFDGIIAPESENTYQFVVKNDTKYNFKYSISFEETNPYNMNLKYKLKKNNKYVIDHYVSYNELKLLNQTLNVNKNDTFYLEWKWISTDHDNYAGENGAKYNLKINIKAESING